MQINRRAKWLVPFIAEASVLLPKLRKLDSITIEEPDRGTIKPTFMGITYQDWGGRYRIILRSHRVLVMRREPLKTKLENYTVIEMLECLAHELAHLRHWKHTPEHKLLECQIKTIFMYRLKRLGYKSDEDNPDKHSV